jgi:hypothetical protein
MRIMKMVRLCTIQCNSESCPDGPFLCTAAEGDEDDDDGEGEEVPCHLCSILDLRSI